MYTYHQIDSMKVVTSFRRLDKKDCDNNRLCPQPGLIWGDFYCCNNKKKVSSSPQHLTPTHLRTFTSPPLTSTSSPLTYLHITPTYQHLSPTYQYLTPCTYVPSHHPCLRTFRSSLTPVYSYRQKCPDIGTQFLTPL